MLEDPHLTNFPCKPIRSGKLISGIVTAYKWLRTNLIRPLHGNTITIDGNLIVKGIISGRGHVNIVVGPDSFVSIPIPRDGWINLSAWSGRKHRALQDNHRVFNENTLIYTAPTEGLYHITFTISWAPQDTTGRRELRVVDVKTESTLLKNTTQPNSSASIQTDQTLSGTIFLKASQQIQPQVYQNSMHPSFILPTRNTQFSVLAFHI